MRKYIFDCPSLRLIGVLSALLWVLWCTHPVQAVENAQPADEAGRIAGIVTNGEGIPLAGIEIRAYLYDPRPEFSESWAYPWWYAGDGIILTDGAGAYQFGNLPPGMYTLRYADPTETYAFEYYNDATMLKEAIRIEVKAGQTTSVDNVLLTLGGTISGYIGMFDGTAVSQLPLTPPGTNPMHYISLLNEDDEWPNVVKRIALSTITFEFSERYFDLKTSRFRFPGLPAGRYRIEYHVTYGGVGYSGGNIYHEFYPNRLAAADAAIITITPEQQAIDLTISVGANPTSGGLEGYVLTTSGEPLQNIAVHAFAQDTQTEDYSEEAALPGRFVRSTVTDETGHYTFSRLAVDNYRLHFFDMATRESWTDPTQLHIPEFYNNATSWDTAEFIHVTEGGTTTANDVVLDRGAQLYGTITMYDGTLLHEADARTDLDIYVRMKLTHQSSLQQQHNQQTDPDAHALYLPIVAQGSATDRSIHGVSSYPLYPFSFDHYASTQSDYTFGGLAPGVYTLTYEVEYWDYHTEPEGLRSHWQSSPIWIEIPNNESMVIHNLTIPEDAVPQLEPNVRGRVINDAGVPLANIIVNATNDYDNATNDSDWTHIHPHLEANTITDDQGVYALSLLPNTGAYIISFSDPAEQYAFEYYQETPALNQATFITPTDGIILQGVDTTLSLASTISGQINLYDGTPLSQATGAPSSDPIISMPRGRILLDYAAKSSSPASTEERWEQMAVIHVPLTGTLQYSYWNSPIPAFDMATNTYSFAGLVPGRYRITVEAFHQGNHYFGSTGATHAITVTAGVTYQDVNLTVGTDNQRVLALYALALDHDPDRIDNLAPQLAPAMQSIIAATRDQPNKTAVVLADAAGVGDTRVYVVQNGRATPVQGLPNAAFQLDPTLTEANMADGATLGNFIRWARNTYPAEVTLFGFVGHGAPLVPASGFADIVAAAGGIRPFGPTDLTTNLFPLPSRVDAYPSLTDNHPAALITPYDLATALRIGSNNGADPLQIADIAHCFSASIEELYELSPNGDQPYAEIILASPTYTYLDPPALGQALGAINTLMTPATMAEQILRTYDGLIEQADLSDGDANVEHPRLLVAVNSRQVARVKADWDKVAYALLQDFDGEKLQQAYRQSPKYDTTLCRPQDWALGPPDALSDLYGFAVALVNVYGAESTVGQAATTVIGDLEDTAILSRYQRNGTPWYAPQNAQFWNFDQHKGIALYTDLQGTPTAKANTLELSWQSRWYTADPLGGENPRPFAFLQNGFNGVTWADVFAEYWRRRPDVTLQTALCFPTLADDPQPAELRAQAIGAPLPNTLHVGVPFTPAALVEVAQATLKPAVRFNLYDTAQTLLYSDTVHGGYWLTGTHQLAAQHAYVPTTAGPLTLELIVDPANHFIEIDEADNRLTQQYLVNAAGPLFPLTVAAQLATPTLVVQHEQVALSTQIHPRHAIAALDAQIYQFTAVAGTDHWQPLLRTVQTLDPAQPVLALAELSPGIVVVHLWARTVAGEYSAAPAVVEFNYAPADQPLTSGERHLYRFPTSLTAFDLTLAAQGNRDLFAWSPANSWAPEWHLDQGVGNGLTLPGGTEAGAYLIVVAGDSAGAYTLTAHPSTNPPTAVVGTDAAMTAPLTRPTLVEPVVTALGNGAWVPGLSIFLPVVQRP